MDDSEIARLVEALRPVKVTAEGGYTPLDRYRDFNAFFSTDGGKRVLAQIADLCDKPVRAHEAGDHAKLVWSAARREVGMQILAWATVVPIAPQAVPAHKVPQPQR